MYRILLAQIALLAIFVTLTAGCRLGYSFCVTDLDCDDGNPCTTERCERKRCERVQIPDCHNCEQDAACDDGQFCNGQETCQGGICQGSVNPCGASVCDEDNHRCGACGNGEVDVLEDCDPGEPRLDQCCDPVSCTWVVAGSDDPQGICLGDHDCLVEFCDGAGECNGLPRDAGTPCDDGAFCTGIDTCDGSGLCVHTGDPCEDGEKCTEITDSCDPYYPLMTRMEAKSYHTCGLTAEGVAWCWGRDHAGQLGDGGESVDTQVPVPVDTSSMTGEKAFVQLAAGRRHTCGLTAEGRAWCWGWDGHGQLGDGGEAVDSQVPVAVDTSPIPGQAGFIQLVAGVRHTCGLTAAGEAWCWGWDEWGQLGNGGASEDSQIPTAVDTSSMTGETTFVKIEAGWSLTCGLTASGVAWCWGYDNNGQLGDGGTFNDSQVPVPVDTSSMTGDTAFVQLSASRYHGCGLTAAGKAWCWGRDVEGQLGEGPEENYAHQSPVAVDVSSMTGERAFVKLTTGAHFTCGLTAEGKAWCWGINDFGQLGDRGASGASSQLPVAVDTSSMTGETALVDIAPGRDHTCAQTAEGVAWCWGRDEYGQLGDGGVAADSLIPVPVDTSSVTGQTVFAHLEAGQIHSGGLTAEGRAWCWGSNNYGALGQGRPILLSQVPVEVVTASMTGEIAMVRTALGYSFSCGLTARGEVWCWGRNHGGQLGNDVVVNLSRVPVALDVTPMTGEIAFTRLTAGRTHACGLTAEGKAWCWGADDRGALGDGDGVNTGRTPVAVDTGSMTGVTVFTQLTAGTQSTCGLTTEGIAWCWGSDGYGQLGDGGSSDDSHVPVEVDTSTMTGATTFTQLAMGYKHCCGLTAAGAVWCWGYNDYGQLGCEEANAASQSPVRVDISTMTGETAFVLLVAGDYHNCGLTAGGVAWCWGRDSTGQLGDGGALIDSQLPVAVDTSTMTGETAFVRLSGGSYHTCGLTAQGAAWCWGFDETGQLGDGGQSVDAQSPVPVDN